MKDMFKTFTNLVIELIKKYKGDWEEVNPSSPNYIKNKPFYSTKKIKTLLKGEYIIEEYNQQLEEFEIVDSTYKIMFNGVEYNCIPYIYEYPNAIEIMLGNLSLDDCGDDTGEPFMIFGYKEGGYSEYNLYVPFDDITTVDLEIIAEIETIYKIDEKYIPQGIGKKMKNNNTSEIFNDYNRNMCTGDYSHAEGYSTYAESSYTHVEGYCASAIGEASHVEGYNNRAYGDVCHVEGKDCVAFGDNSHVEGYLCYSGEVAHYSHAEGNTTKTFGYATHTEGRRVCARGDYSHAEGYSSNMATDVLYLYSSTLTTDKVLSEWNSAKFTLAMGYGSHCEGNNALTLGSYSHAEGTSCLAQGDSSHAEGDNCSAKSMGSHAEGGYSVASGTYSHAEGHSCEATGNYSHAEGRDTYATKESSHAEGNYTQAKGIASHSEGLQTLAGSNYQHVQGKYNIEDTEAKYSHIVGNGYDSTTRSNAHTLDWNGNGWYKGNLYVGGTSQDDGNKVLSTADINFDSDGNLTITINGVTKKFAPIE